jgi:uncharacterized OB-fold protein
MQQLVAKESPRPATSYTRIDETGTPYLLGSRCGECGTVFLGVRENCGRCCARRQMQAVRLAVRGRLYSYTIVYRSYPGIRVPFISAIVDLDEGGTIKGNLVDIEPSPQKLAYGMPVSVVFRGAECALGEEAVGYVAHFFVPDLDRS